MMYKGAFTSAYLFSCCIYTSVAIIVHAVMYEKSYTLFTHLTPEYPSLLNLLFISVTADDVQRDWS